MKNFITLTTSVAILSGLFFVTGCSSSDDGSVSAGVPANAVTITDSNAEPTVQAAADSSTTISSAIGVETTQIINLKTALNIIKPSLKSLSSNSTDIATGVEYSEACSGGGSISGSGTETNDGTTYTLSANAYFNNCVELGSIINGNVTYTSTEYYSTGAYTDEVSGSLNMVLNNGNDAFNFTGFVYSETGNYFDYTFTINQLIYAIDFTSGGINGGGFLVSLVTPIVESTGDLCPESGHILITGANDTTAEGIYNGDGTMTIKANGTVVNATALCYY